MKLPEGYSLSDFRNNRSNVYAPQQRMVAQRGMVAQQQAANQTCSGAFYILSPNDGDVTSLTPEFSGIAACSATLTLSIDGGTEQTIPIDSEGYWSYTMPDELTPGIHKAEFSATLPCACTGSASTCYVLTITFTAEREAPAPIVEYPQDGDILDTDTPYLYGTGVPGNEIAVIAGEYEYTTTVSADGAWIVFVENPLGTGTQYIQVVQTDTEGNPSKPVVLAVRVGTLNAPLILSPMDSDQLPSPEEPLTGLALPFAKIRIVAESMDDPNGMPHAAIRTYTVQADRYGQWSWAPTEATDLGNVLLSVYQTDGQGNSSPPVTRALYIASGDIPAPTFTFPENGQSVMTEQLTIQGTGIPGYTATVTLKGEEHHLLIDSDGNWFFLVPDPIPTGYITVTATQHEYNGSSFVIHSPKASITFLSHEPYPAPIIVSPTEGELFFTTRPEINGTGITGIEGLIVLTNINGAEETANIREDGTWRGYLSNSLPEGPLVVRAAHYNYLTDEKGLEAMVTATIRNVPRTGPVPTDGSLYSIANPVLIGSGMAGMGVEVLLDDQTFSTFCDCFGHWRIEDITPLADGEHTLTAYLIDWEGREGPHTTNVFTVDTQTP